MPENSYSGIWPFLEIHTLNYFFLVTLTNVYHSPKTSAKSILSTSRTLFVKRLSKMNVELHKTRFAKLFTPRDVNKLRKQSNRKSAKMYPKLNVQQYTIQRKFFLLGACEPKGQRGDCSPGFKMDSKLFVPAKLTFSESLRCLNFSLWIL